MVGTGQGNRQPLFSSSNTLKRPKHTGMLLYSRHHRLLFRVDKRQQGPWGPTSNVTGINARGVVIYRDLPWLAGQWCKPASPPVLLLLLLYVDRENGTPSSLLKTPFSSPIFGHLHHLRFSKHHTPVSDCALRSSCIRIK